MRYHLKLNYFDVSFEEKKGRKEDDADVVTRGGAGLYIRPRFVKKYLTYN